MMAAAVVSAAGVHTFGGEGYAPAGVIRGPDGQDAATDATLSEVALIAALCNEATLHKSDAELRVERDPIEGTLLALDGKIDGGAKAHGSWTRTDVIRFDAAHRYMAVLAHDHEGHGGIFVKGGPEDALALCSGQWDAEGDASPLDPAHWHADDERLAGEGQRVIVVAARKVRQAHVTLIMADLEGRLSLLGLLGLIEPPRPGAIATVAECHASGIRVELITSDHAGKARSIARQIGLKNTDRVLTGTDIDAMDDGMLAAAAATGDIFVRASSAHKLRLVTALQSPGLIVAMTGDGVNYAPVLKRADADIAMGRKGSEAANEVADLVLAHDNFASIASAVWEGRTVHDNIKNMISWTLSNNAGEAMTIIVALLAGMALSIKAVQILSINLITAVTLGLAPAFELGEDGTMHRPPRPRDQPLLTGELVWHIVPVLTLFLAAVFGIVPYAIDRGYPQELAQTMAVNTLVLLEIFHLFFIRNIHGTSLTWAVARR